jgi:acyl dehydratase
MGALYFDDFLPGDKYESGARTVTEADVVHFAGLSGDFNPLHTDAVHAERSPMGERIAHGLLVLSIASGLINQTGIFAGSVIAFLGIDEWKFGRPVRLGDTIHVEMEVLETRLTSKKDRGVVRWRRQVVNQRDEVVQEGVITLLVAVRGEQGVAA